MTSVPAAEPSDPEVAPLPRELDRPAPLRDPGAVGGRAVAYGVASIDGACGIVARHGDQALDLVALARATRRDLVDLLAAPTLNRFLAAGRRTWQEVDAWIASAIATGLADGFSHHVDELCMLLPVEVADYVDFYASEHHATNAGKIFRPNGDPLLPNWKHLPVGYHGRAGTVVVSGTPIIRPCGQRRAPDAPAPLFGPTERLDVEVELGFVVGVGSPLGHRVAARDWRDHVFGVVVVNDWSARDIQAWESAPLGPMLGKSFATSISAWVTPLDALSAAWVDPPPRDVALLDYLADPPEPCGLDIRLELAVNGKVISRPRFAGMYWTGAQQLAHLTANGASLRTGDLYASGTISGPTPEERGCLLEITWGGQQPLELHDDRILSYLEDGDQVVIRAHAPGPAGSTITLGEVAGTIQPASWQP